ncbi:hypothetical protein B0J13DRAFT_447804 [Dactylonectria estremocensis]|uniref:Zn(2)-C6 fungal-type domain-containing protein n=1 Tax=Dactylonectria estremocensis TaxID=1079267 RepID=A0A9P9J2Q0_9HYPO|nr:hypothetical protein B0J13DRAFT_447804 [Dactylonectria estremocensis]
MPPARTAPTKNSKRYTSLYRACQPCRTHKVACDRQLPCSKCIKRGIVALCGNPGEPRPTTLGTGKSPRWPSPAQDLAPPLPAPVQTALPASHSGDEEESSSPGTPKSRMVLGARGQHVYVGSSAAISFLQYLRDTLRHHAGPSSFTESAARDTMLEADVKELADDLSIDTLDPKRTEALTDHFLESEGLLNLFTDGQIARLRRRTNGGTGAGPVGLSNQCYKAVSGQDELIPLHLIIAIGAQSRGHDDVDARWARMHFGHAQRLIFKDMLQDLSIGMVINFLLMAFYLFGACQRNTSALYLGVASRAATILGLPSAELQGTSTPELQQHRARVWSSLCILDVHFNAILGQPTSICLGLEQRNQQLSSQQPVNVTAEELLRRLREWANTLPPELRSQIRRRGSSLDISERRSITGSLHVACAYYNSVIIVTRPFLVARVSPALRGQPGWRLEPDPRDSSNISTPEHSKAYSMPRACVTAAVHMLTLCRDAVHLDLLSGNMCMLQ